MKALGRPKGALKAVSNGRYIRWVNVVRPYPALHARA
jgi:hypothetical protein